MGVCEDVRIEVQELPVISTDWQPPVHITFWQFPVFGDMLCLKIVEVSVNSREMSFRDTGRALDAYPESNKQNCKQKYGFESR